MHTLPEHENVDHGEDLDICGCDFEVDDAEITKDGELPAARGGVQSPASQSDDEGQVDGCDVDFNAFEATGDADLPAARGGVK